MYASDTLTQRTNGRNDAIILFNAETKSQRDDRI